MKKRLSSIWKFIKQNNELIDYAVITAFMVVMMYYLADFISYMQIPHHTINGYFHFYRY